MISKEEYTKAIDIIIQYRNQRINDVKNEIIELKSRKKELKKNLSNELLEIDSILPEGCLLNSALCDCIESFRTYNLIKANLDLLFNRKERSFKDIKVIELAGISERKLISIRGIGLKSIKEIKNLCQRAGISMEP